MLPIINLDVSALGETYFTGISNVAKFMAREILADPTVEGRFWFNRQCLTIDIAKELTQTDRGPPLKWMCGRMRFDIPKYEAGRTSIGIYPSHKWHRRLFPFEVLIIHDLSAVITPEFHDRKTIEWENNRLLPDMLSSDLIASVSEATKRDIYNYFPLVRHIPIITSHLAPCSALNKRAEKIEIDPYILVLGTLEPRKNIEIVLRMLHSEPGWLERFAFVFVGRYGWGPDMKEMLTKYNLSGAAELGRIQFPGFLDDEDRDDVIRHSQCTIYPSRFEGFGLPVLEALAMGIPVVTGRGGSLPEVGGVCAVYVDVTSPSSLSSGITAALSDDSRLKAEERIAWGRSFSWRQTYERIRDAALQQRSNGSQSGGR